MIHLILENLSGRGRRGIRGEECVRRKKEWVKRNQSLPGNKGGRIVKEGVRRGNGEERRRPKGKAGEEKTSF